MSFFNRNSNTIFNSITKEKPEKGTVFIHANYPDRPLIVSLVNDENIYRVDIEGTVSIWGTLEDWCEDLHRRYIKIVYIPPKK